MIVGTNYFVSLYHACKYYLPYGFDSIGVKQKIKDGEIKIGRPELKEDEEIVLLDDKTRYGIKHKVLR